MTDSLVLADTIELMAGGLTSTIASCSGVIFSLAPGYDLSEPQPVSDYVAAEVLDGSVPVGQRADNRTITLPLVIWAPAATIQAAGSETALRLLLLNAREELQRLVDKPSFPLRWTREGGQPLIFDCYRAAASKPTYNTKAERQGWLPMEVSFSASPYGHSDVPVTTDYQSPLAAVQPPPAAQTIDNFATVSGAQWSASSVAAPGLGGGSALWDPSASPAQRPDGAFMTPTLSKSGLALNLSQGWAVISQSTGLVNQFTSTTADGNKVQVGDQFQIAGSALTGDNSTFEGSLGNWRARPLSGNCTVTQTTAQAHSGTHSMQLSSTAAGNMSAVSGDSTSIATLIGTAQQCQPGDTCYASGWFRAQASVRGCQIGLAFFDAYDNLIQTGFGVGGAVNDSTSAWTQVSTSVGAIAPAQAAWCMAVAQVNSTGAAAEIHYVDDVQVFTRSGQPLQSQIFTVLTVSQPFAGFVNITFTPNANAAPTTGQVLIQSGPPQLPAATVWAGFGSDNYYWHWGRHGGPVHFLLTLTDTYGNTVQSSRVVPLARGSNTSGNPKWVKVRIPLTFKSGFDYTNVSGYTITVTNRGPYLSYTQLYLASLLAVPRTAQLTPSPLQRGVVYDMQGMVGSARVAPNFTFQQAGALVTTTVQFNKAGTFNWKAPPYMTGGAVSNVLAIGGGGTSIGNALGFGSGGASGGGSGVAASVAVTPGNVYKVVVGQGAFWTPAFVLVLTLATASTFTGDSVTVTGPAGVSNPSTPTGTPTTAGAVAAAAGTPSGFASGAGGAGAAGSTGAGGGGGSSGGSAGAGNPGAAAVTTTGGAGGAAPTGGGSGGRGGSTNHGNGVRGTGPGGGTGGSPGNASGYLYPGDDGSVSFQYTAPPTFKTLLVHRPGYNAPEEFNPLLPIPAGDPVDGSVQYIMPTLTYGIQARFDGTYTVVIVSQAWNNPSAARTITVTVTLFEQWNGNNYAQTVSQTIIPNNLGPPAGTPFVILGNLTIPLNELPPDNLNAFFTVSVTDTNTADTFYDVLFLDTRGSTVMLASPNAYTQVYIDEPLPLRDIGMVMGTVSDRTSAVSLLSAAQMISGDPLSIDPNGNQSLLAYCVEGAPNMQMKYRPRWNYDRLA